jgi:hypothetical protein
MRTHALRPRIVSEGSSLCRRQENRRDAYSAFARDKVGRHRACAVTSASSVEPLRIETSQRV